MSAISSLSCNRSIISIEQEDRDPDSLSVEEVAEVMVASKREEFRQAREESLRRESEARLRKDLYWRRRQFDPPSEEYWSGKREDFIHGENMLRKDKEFMASLDTYEPAGGLSYSMNYPEIAAHVQKKFDDLRASGILFSRSEFESKEDRTKFRTLGWLSKPDKKSGELSRLWGAEYLRKHLNPEGPHRVPRFVVIIENHVRTLPVQIDAGEKALHLNFDTSYGEILAEKINGPAICDHLWDATSELVELGYVDYSDPGNIRLGSDGKRYIVDTEWKSLEGVAKSSEYVFYQNYTKERFQTFHQWSPWTPKTFNVEINL